MEQNTLPKAPELKTDGLAEKIEKLETVDTKKRAELKARISEGDAMQSSLDAIRKRLKGALSEVGELRSQEARGDKIDAKALNKARETVAFARQETEELEASIEAHLRKEGAASAEAEQAARDLACAKMELLAARRHAYFLTLIEKAAAMSETVTALQQLQQAGYQLAGPKYNSSGGLNSILRAYGLYSDVNETGFERCRPENSVATENTINEMIRVHAITAASQDNYNLACEKSVQRDPLPVRSTSEPIDQIEKMVPANDEAA